MKYKSIPYYIFLVSIIIGLVSMLAGATKGEAILVGVLTELTLVVHSLKFGQTKIQNLLGNSEGINLVSKILTSASKIQKSNNVWADLLLQQSLQRSFDDISLLESGKIELTAEHFMDFSERMFGSMGKMDTLYATSLFGGGEYWKKMYGVAYSRYNSKAAENGARIIRIFIPRDSDHQNQLARIYEKQSEYSDIYLCDYAKLTELDSKAAGDFFVLNRSLAVEFIFRDDELTHLEKVLVTTHPATVNAYCKRMDTIHKISENYEKSAE